MISDILMNRNKILKVNRSRPINYKYYCHFRHLKPHFKFASYYCIQLKDKVKCFSESVKENSFWRQSVP